MTADFWNNLEAELFPTVEKEMLISNQIKKADFIHFHPYIPSIFDESEERNKVVWVNTGKGFLWFYKPTKKKNEPIFVPKNRINKIYEFAILKKDNNIK